MAPVPKHRGNPRQPEIALEKYVSSLDSVPDETVLGRLQEALEALLSERSHPMMVGLSKQLDQLKTAENVINREIDVRKRPVAATATGKRKRGRRESRSERLAAAAAASNSPAASNSAEPSSALPDRKGASNSADAKVKVESDGGSEARRAENDDGTDEHRQGSDDERARDDGANALRDTKDEVLEKDSGRSTPTDPAAAHDGSPSTGEPQSKQDNDEDEDRTLTKPELSETPAKSDVEDDGSREDSGNDSENDGENDGREDANLDVEENGDGDVDMDADDEANGDKKPELEEVQTEAEEAGAEIGEGNVDDDENDDDEDEDEEGEGDDDEAEDDDDEAEDAADGKNAHSYLGTKHIKDNDDDEGEGNDDDNDENSDNDSETSRSERAAGNTKFVPNPKSEFVSTQSLPRHTLGLFDETSQDEDEERRKQRLGVVSYPKEDLSTLTAGPVPTEDFTRAKPSNQVQFSTYATFLEPYFRQFTDEDIQFLQQPAVGSGVEAANLQGGKRLSPYVFPPLGPHYRQQWAAQDAELSGVEVPEIDRKTAASQVAKLAHMAKPAGSVSEINDSNLESQALSLSLGPFTERLVAAVMAEVYDPASAGTGGNASGTNANSNSASSGSSGSGSGGPSTNFGELEEASAKGDGVPPKIERAIASIPPAPTGTPLIEDFGHLEERVKGEFRYVGVLDMALLRKFEKTKSEFKLAMPRSRDEYADPSVVEMDWVNGAEDDEISRELRLLQRRLHEVSRRNNFYKERLTPVVQEQLSWQEYQSILQDLDKQVDQAYTKRLKQPKVVPPKPKKRKGSIGLESSDGMSPGGASTPDLQPVSKIPDQKPAIKALIDKRERWLTKIGPLFRPSHEMMREYVHPKFEDIDDEYAPEDEEEEDREE